MLPLIPPAFIVLPNPISTNGLYNNVPGRGRVKTREYKDWSKTASKILMLQRPLPLFGLPVEVTFYVGEKYIGQMDSDNTIKAYMDAIKEAGVIRDDSRKWVRRCSAVWVPRMSACVAKIKVAESDINADFLRDIIHPNLRGLLH